MPELFCTARRVGDHESRTEEYELSYGLGEGEPEEIRVKYQAARAYEINYALDAAVDAARGVISGAATQPAQNPTDQQLAQLTWRTIQSAKYEEGEPKTSTLEM